jgi:hypothetical protein
MEVSMSSATTGEVILHGGRWIRGIGLALGAGLLLISPSAGSEAPEANPEIQSLDELPKLDPSYQMNSHTVVLITADSLNPATVELAPGQLIAWISYSPTKSTVVFESDVAKSMVCHSRVNFSFDEGELRSAPINAGEFASFCELKPGSYRYKVVRAGAPEAQAGSMLEGEIVVGKP